MNNELTDEQMERLSKALENGRKIDAIKTYREATGLGLKEAKDAVEKLHADLRLQYPDRFPVRSAGCGSSAALIGLALGIAYLASRLPA